jgi:hypothetical protein
LESSIDVVQVGLRVRPCPCHVELHRSRCLERLPSKAAIELVVVRREGRISCPRAVRNRWRWVNCSPLEAMANERARQLLIENRQVVKVGCGENQRASRRQLHIGFYLCGPHRSRRGKYFPSSVKGWGAGIGMTEEGGEIRGVDALPATFQGPAFMLVRRCCHGHEPWIGFPRDHDEDGHRWRVRRRMPGVAI